MTIAISLDRIVDCVLAHSALDGLRNERPALLCRENSPALKRIALDSLAQIVAGLGINIKKTDIDLGRAHNTAARQHRGQRGMRHTRTDMRGQQPRTAVVAQSARNVGTDPASAHKKSYLTSTQKVRSPPGGTRLKTPRRILPPYTSAESGRRVFSTAKRPTAPRSI